MPKLPMPPFVPTSGHFPKWITAVPIIKSYLPRKLQFAVIPEGLHNGRVDVDSSWFVALGQACPPEDRMKLEELGSKAVALIMGRWHEYAEFSGLMNRNLTPSLMARLNNLINTIDRVAETEGEPTNLQIIRHLFGIAPAPGTRLEHIEVKATIDHEKLRGLIGDRGFKVYQDPNPDMPTVLGLDYAAAEEKVLPLVDPELPTSFALDLITDEFDRKVLTLRRYDIAVPYRHLGVALLSFTMFKSYLMKYIDRADLVYFEETDSDFQTRSLLKDRHNPTPPPESQSNAPI